MGDEKYSLTIEINRDKLSDKYDQTDIQLETKNSREDKKYIYVKPNTMVPAQHAGNTGTNRKDRETFITDSGVKSNMVTTE